MVKNVFSIGISVEFDSCLKILSWNTAENDENRFLKFHCDSSPIADILQRNLSQ